MKIFITNILFSLNICAVILFFRNEKSNIQLNEIVIYSFGLGPAFASIICYWGIFLFPYKTNIFYFSLVIVFFTILLCFSIFVIKKQFSNFKKNILFFRHKLRQQLKSKKKIFIFVLFSIFFLSLFISSISFYIKSYLSAPLIGHDVQIYATEGKIFFDEKSFEYKYSRRYPQLNFREFTKHAPGFSLLLTWEKILNKIFHLDTNSDYYFKSISPYFGLLILLTAFYWLSRMNIVLAFLGIFAFFSSFIFTKSFLFNHIDTYRIFFLSVSWIMLARYLKDRDNLSLALLGIFSGLSAFAHSIGAIIVCFNCLTTFLFLNDKLINKIISVSIIFLCILIFGGYHYIYDILWGRGWIF